ncbi:autotransporter outer membrane beta-barrel domain-containing protein [Brucellaceae bacterium C25G]
MFYSVGDASNLVRKHKKALSLSSLMILFGTSSVTAQEITQPIVLNSGSQEISEQVLNISSGSNPAINVKNASLTITSSDLNLVSDKYTVQAGAGATINLTGEIGRPASVTATGEKGATVYGLSNSTLLLQNLNIEARGDNSIGVNSRGTYGSLNATLNLSNSAIKTVSGRGVYVSDSNVTADSFDISTGWDASIDAPSSQKFLYGFYAENKNFVTLTNGQIETWSDNSIGINAVMDYTNSDIERLRTKDVSIITHGNNAIGIDNINTRSFIEGGHIVTNGIGAHGIGSSNGGSSSFVPSHVIVEKTKITTNGLQAYGLVASLSSDIQAAGISIVTSGESGAGVYSQGTGRINLTENSTIRTTGLGGHGVAAMLGTEINISDTLIETTGTNAAGIYTTGYNNTDNIIPNLIPNVFDLLDEPLPVDDDEHHERDYISTGESISLEDEDRAGRADNNIVNLTRTEINVQDAAVLRVLGSAKTTITISDSKLIAGSGTNALLFSSGIYNGGYEVGLAEINVSSSQLAGDVVVDSGHVNFELTENSVWSGTARESGKLILNSLSMDSTSTWFVTGSSSVNYLINDGNIKFSNEDDIFKILTVQSDYTGNDSYIHFNAILGGDLSSTDALTINGNTDGLTNITITNVGGTGAQTVEGIKIIEVGGSSEGVFILQSNYEHQGDKAVVGGAYAYKLYQGGVSTPTDGDWYLRSQLIDDEPLYQSGAPVYEVYPQALLGLNSLPTLQQRVGNRLWAGSGNRVVAQGADTINSPYADPEETGATINGNGVWGRIEGSHNHMKPRISTSDTNYDQNVFKMQTGIDGMLNEAESGKLIGSITAHYAHGKTKTNSAHGDGNISTDGYGFGATLTWYGENGFYLDAQSQVTWYRSDLHSTTPSARLTDNNHGFGYALSLEAGKRFALNDAWSLTPQGQLIYSHINFDAFTDVFDADVSLNRGQSLQGQLRLMLAHENSWQNAHGKLDRTIVYGIANLDYEFLNGTRVNVAQTQFTNRNDRLWGGIGTGGSYNWNDNKYSVYGEGLINTSLNDFADSYAVKGNIGFRIKW